MYLRIQEARPVDNTTVLFAVSEQWQFQQALHMEGSSAVEKLELFGTYLCGQMLHQFLLVDPTGGDRQRICAVEGTVVCLPDVDAWATTVVQ